MVPACASVTQEAEDPLSPGGKDYSKLWSHHCTPAWATEQDSVSKKKKRKKKFLSRVLLSTVVGQFWLGPPSEQNLETSKKRKGNSLLLWVIIKVFYFNSQSTCSCSFWSLWVIFYILSRIFHCNQWKKEVIVSLFHLGCSQKVINNIW